MNPEDIVVHVSDQRLDVLKPQPQTNGRDCIYFSVGKFISYFGQWVYIFSKPAIERLRHDVVKPAGCISSFHKSVIPEIERKYQYRGRELPEEWRVYEPAYAALALCVVENWNYTKGQFVMWTDGMVLKHDMADMREHERQDGERVEIARRFVRGEHE